jgi:hypothetical protein
MSGCSSGSRTGASVPSPRAQCRFEGGGVEEQAVDVRNGTAVACSQPSRVLRCGYTGGSLQGSLLQPQPLTAAAAHTRAQM